jgi:predicted exporter
VSQVLGALNGLRRKARLPLLGVFGLITLGLALCLPMVGFDGDVMNLDGKSDETRASEQQVQQAFGQETLSRTLVVSSGATLESALRENDLNARALHALGATFEGVSWVLPATETQRENIERWQRFWGASRLETLKQAMAKAKAIHPNTKAEITFSPEQIESGFGEFLGYVRLSGGAPQVLEPARVRKKPLWALLASYVRSPETDRRRSSPASGSCHSVASPPWV